MPKRKCHFDINLSQQLKRHISQKELDERNDVTMSKIHSKTLDMLFQGAKNIYKPGKNNGAQNNFSSNENTRDFCVMCNDINTVICKCSYCDKCLCTQCLTNCINCDLPFCKSCSTKLYLHNNSDGYCFSCYSEGKFEL